MNELGKIYTNFQKKMKGRKLRLEFELIYSNF